MPIGIAGSGSITGASTINGLTMPTDAIAPGLVKIIDQSFSASSAVSVNNCFSSTYDNYKMLLDINSFSTTDAWIFMRLRASGTDDSGANYQTVRVYAQSTSSGGDTNGGGDNTKFIIGYASSSYPDRPASSYDILSPNLARNTTILGTHYYVTSTALGTLNCVTGSHYQSTQFDGISFSLGAGTFGGTIRIYGYRN